jgi:hypothetical protein
MSEIEARGHMYRRLSRGRTSWWLILASWPLFGIPSLVILGLGIAQCMEATRLLLTKEITMPDFISFTLPWLMYAVVPIALILITTRGTLGKFKHRQHR